MGEPAAAVFISAAPYCDPIATGRIVMDGFNWCCLVRREQKNVDKIRSNDTTRYRPLP